MKNRIKTDKSRVIYIEYSDRIPHSVITEKQLSDGSGDIWFRHVWWDFIKDIHGDIYYYEAGSGPKGTIDLPHFIDGYIGDVWVANDVEIDSEGKNNRLLKHKKRFKLSEYQDTKTTNDPFLMAYEECGNYEYCRECEGYHVDDWCREHMYEDEDDDYQLKYDKDGTYVQD